MAPAARLSTMLGPVSLFSCVVMSASENSESTNWKWLAIKFVVSIVLIAGVLTGSRGVFDRLSSLKKEPPREEPVIPVYRVEAFALSRSPIQRFVAGFGTAAADREVVVSAEVAGRVTETEHLRVGDRVTGPQIGSDAEGKSQRTTGDTILQIDPQTYEERVTQSQAIVTQDEVDLQKLNQDEATNKRFLTQQEERLATATRELERAKELLAKQAGREADVSRADLEVQQYHEGLIRLQSERDLFAVRRQQWETQVSRHRSDLNLTMLELEKAHVRAPFSGMLSDVFVEEGQYVRPGEPLIKITDSDLVVVPVPVTLEDAGILTELLAKGTQPRAELVPDESTLISGGQVWIGKVVRISPLADERTRTVQVFVEVDNRDVPAPLRPGTFVYARIEADILEAQVGWLVPRDAIVNDSVFVAEEAPADSAAAPDQSENSEGKVAIARSVPVKTVRSLQSFALVQGELPEDAHVVMTNLDIVVPGSHLDVRNVHSLADELARLKVAYLAPLSSTPDDSADQ